MALLSGLVLAMQELFSDELCSSHAFSMDKSKICGREQQRKIIKYNHLVSNCLIFYNVFEISRILQEYIQAGNTIEKEILGALSPYLTKHINRFGSYSLDLNRQPPTLDFGFSLIPSS